jgi:hypothetical protein
MASFILLLKRGVSFEELGTTSVVLSSVTGTLKA